MNWLRKSYLIYSFACMSQYVTRMILSLQMINTKGLLTTHLVWPTLEIALHITPQDAILVRSQNCGCLVTWFCYQLIASQVTRQPHCRGLIHTHLICNDQRPGDGDVIGTDRKIWLLLALQGDAQNDGHLQTIYFITISIWLLVAMKLSTPSSWRFQLTYLRWKFILINEHQWE